jgi:hypothetical protein
MFRSFACRRQARIAAEEARQIARSCREHGSLWLVDWPPGALSGEADTGSPKTSATNQIPGEVSAIDPNGNRSR